ncbi:MAG: D-glycero-alpha-D-manno-heptose-1,7-bisphosphate 7-phosphatase [Longimicrobiales bacterium]
MSEPASPAVFLDRDGTLIEERSYLADPAGVRLLPGVVDGLRALRAAGYKLIVITNQSGIARGLINEAQYERVRARLDALLALGGVALDGVYHCPHHPAITGACACRKPGVELYERAATDHAIDLHRSAFVGDKPADVEPAAVLGGRAILVRTGYGRMNERAVGAQVRVADDFAGAVEQILKSAAEDAPGTA